MRIQQNHIRLLRQIKGRRWVITVTITITVLLLVISFLIAYSLFRLETGEYTAEEEQHLLSTVASGFIVFCFFNVLETFFSIYLIIQTLTLEKNSALILEVLIWKLKSSKVIETNWSIDSMFPDQNVLK